MNDRPSNITDLIPRHTDEDILRRLSVEVDGNDTGWTLTRVGISLRNGDIVVTRLGRACRKDAWEITGWEIIERDMTSWSWRMTPYLGAAAGVRIWEAESKSYQR